MKAVCDTSSLIKLRKCAAVDCLGLLFDTILIPAAVKEECRDPATASVLTKSFFEIRPVRSILSIGGIGIGELEAISLAVESNTPVLITDDEKAAKKALQTGCKPIRTTQILLLAKLKGHIPSVKSALDAMRAQGEGIEDGIYEATLSQAGEI